MSSLIRFSAALALGSVTSVRPPLDFFESAFGQADHVSRENIRGPWGHGFSGYRVTLEFKGSPPSMEEVSQRVRRNAVLLLTTHRCDVESQRSFTLDQPSESSCDIWARQEGRVVHFHALSFTEGQNRYYISYEWNEDSGH